MEGKLQLINFKLKKVTKNSSHSSYQTNTHTQKDKKKELKKEEDSYIILIIIITKTKN